MRKLGLSFTAFRNNHTNGCVTFALGQFIPGEDPTARQIHVIAGYEGYRAMMVRAGVVRPLAPECLNALRAPVTVREMVDAVFIDLLLGREVRPSKLPARARFLFRSSDLLRP